MTEYWNEQLTKASWKKLQEISKLYDFILIGGWAIFLWTGKHKSKDIDIVVDFKTLEQLKQDFTMIKNDRLKKYEIRFDKFDIDIYVPFYSQLAIPLEKIRAVRVQGIKTASPEQLLILKQGAEIKRRYSIKGKKDAIDILTLLIYADIDIGKYKKLLEEYGIRNYLSELKRVIKEFSAKDIKFLDMDLKAFRDWQKSFLKILSKPDKTRK
ncbi:MAG: hypothetical protein J7K68_00325 [Candidatus Diapherotrites archaeon]|nr:hypothetical protein [Candidatus Diapherotrites archaeon]